MQDKLTVAEQIQCKKDFMEQTRQFNTVQKNSN